MTYATADERYLLSLVNATRAAHGRDALSLERHLNLAADRHSAWMLQADTFSHTGSGDSSSSDRMRSAGFDLSNGWKTGENIAYISIDNDGTLTDEIRQLHQNLMNSPSHRATLLSRDYDMVGLGLQVGQFDYGGRSYTVLMLTEDFASTGGHVEYDLAPGISIHTADAPGLTTLAPLRSDWTPLFDGRVYRQSDGRTELSGTGRADDFRLGSAADRANGAGGNDWMSGENGADRLRGGSGHDRLLGQNGKDVLSGEGGNDSLAGGSDDDLLTGAGGHDHLRGDSGHDRLHGQTGNDALAGGSGNDLLRGDSGADRLDGGGGSDSLQGGASADVLRGGGGNDMLQGDGGYDSFVFQGMTGRDRILDYQPRVDRIMIDDRLIDVDLEVFVRTEIRKTASGVLIELDDNQTILVAGDLSVQQVADGIFLI